MDVFGAGTYTVEVQSSKTGFQAIGAIRVCSSKGAYFSKREHSILYYLKNRRLII